MIDNPEAADAHKTGKHETQPLNPASLVPTHIQFSEADANQKKVISQKGSPNQQATEMSLELKGFNSVVVSGAKNPNISTNQTTPALPSKRGRPRMDSKLTQNTAQNNADQQSVEPDQKRQKTGDIQGQGSNGRTTTINANAQQSLNDLVDSLSKRTGHNFNSKNNGMSTDQAGKKKQEESQDPQTQLLNKIKQLQ